MTGGGPALIDDDLRTFLRGPVSAILATADALLVPDVTRIGGVMPLDGASMRILIGDGATEARANAAEPGAALSVLITDIVTYRSMQWKGTVVSWHERTPGDLTVLHDHIERFVEAAPTVGIDPVAVRRTFPTEVVALVVAFDELFDQTPGPGAGRKVDGPR
jgi:hypothetical protein